MTHEGHSHTTITDAEALDKIAELHLGEMSYENPSSALESIGMLIEQTGRTVRGRVDD